VVELPAWVNDPYYIRWAAEVRRQRRERAVKRIVNLVMYGLIGFGAMIYLGILFMLAADDWALLRLIIDLTRDIF